MPNEIYTENDVKENIDNGNIYKEPNIKCELTLIDDYIFHPTPDDSEYLINFKTMFVECALGSPSEPITEGYMYFKDGSYIKLVLNPDWSTGVLPLVTNMRFESYFGISDTEGNITEYLFASATSLPATKHYWEYNIITQLWDMTEIVYQTGDKFRLYLGWWDVATPKLRTIFVPYIVGGGQFTLETYNNVMSRNTLSSGMQAPVQLGTTTGQIIASFLCGDTTQGTKYPDEESTEGGGHGTFYRDNFAIPRSSFPTTQPIDWGFSTIYSPSDADMKTIARWLWSDDFEENIKMNFSSPFENILTLAMVRLDLDDYKELHNFVIGNTDSTIQTTKINNEYIPVDCGTVYIEEYWGSFLDYDSTFTIWLPFIGYRSLKADEVLEKYLGVTYKVDLLTGIAVCEIYIINDGLEQVLYSYNCNIFYNCSLSGANYTSMYNQQLNATVSGINNFVQSVGNIAKGNYLSGLTSIFTGQAQAKREYETAKPEYGRGGNSGGNSGLFSVLYPYLIVKQAITQAPKNYNELVGNPSQIFEKLSDLEGYTEIETANVSQLTHCTDTEQQEILKLLQGGVFL